jgi:hypothetical protein
MPDYIPKNDAAFDAFFTFMTHYVNAQCTGAHPAWTHIPAGARAAQDAAYAAWHAAYVPVIGPHTPVDTEAKNNAKAAAKAAIRPFVNQYLRFSPVTREDRTAMGIRSRNPPKPVPRPADIPEVEAQTPHPRVLRFRFRRANMKRWGKPKNVHGMELVWLISDTPPKLVEDLVHSSFATRSPLELTFEENQRGRRLYYAARWETGTAKQGDFGEIYSAIVP